MITEGVIGAAISVARKVSGWLPGVSFTPPDVSALTNAIGNVTPLLPVEGIVFSMGLFTSLMGLRLMIMKGRVIGKIFGK